ncbi:MAG: ATP synthase F1 subunit epsilon [Clostridia bacterium]|nr:ATP synthase F1 subunit epsilon [Clostridia bacterium]
MADKPEQNAIYVEIVTPYGMFFEGPAEMVVVTSKDGQIGIMAGHTPLIAALTPGEIRMLIKGSWRILSATNGYAEIGPELMIIVVNAAEWPEQIDLGRAEAALARAEKRYHDPSSSSQEKIHARHAIERAKARIKVKQKASSLSLKIE